MSIYIYVYISTNFTKDRAPPGGSLLTTRLGRRTGLAWRLPRIWLHLWVDPGLEMLITVRASRKKCIAAPFFVSKND
jgi:hypothetical protein